MRDMMRRTWASARGHRHDSSFLAAGRRKNARRSAITIGIRILFPIMRINITVIENQSMTSGSQRKCVCIETNYSTRIVGITQMIQLIDF